MKNYLWVEKYRPKNIDEFLGDQFIKDKIKEWSQDGQSQHLLLYGRPGVGKTSLAKILASTGGDYLYINASDENSIETIRDKVIPYASAISFSGIKYVILDEADYLTKNAQATLRNVIESFSEGVRFILTCNYFDRIIDALSSRCYGVKINAVSKQDMFMYITGILDRENVKYQDIDLANIIKKHYPDIRKILNDLQIHSIKGELKLSTTQSHLLSDIILSGLKNKESIDYFRQEINNKSNNEFDDLFTHLYNHIDEFDSKKIAEIIICLGKNQYEYSFAINKEITIMKMIIELLNIIK